MRRIGLVGFGLIGRERLLALQELRAEGLALDVVGVVDPSPVETPADVTRLHGLDELLAAAPDFTIVATPHDVAVAIAEQLVVGGSAVLIEKPPGRSLAEARRLEQASNSSGRAVHVGMNYRFFDGVRHLLADVGNGWFGDPISARITLGHGGAPGDESTWKLDPVRAGGGCLIDPGIHAFDLAGCMARGIEVRHTQAWSGFWGTGIEEASHIVMTSREIPLMQLDVSIVRWRSTFEVEIIGSDGYGIVTGRGRSYGPQSYRRGRRWGWKSGASQEESEEEVVRSDGTESFREELRAIVSPQDSSSSSCTLEESLVTMELLERARAQAEER